MSLFDDDEITSDGGAFQGYSKDEKAKMRAEGKYTLDDYKPYGCLSIFIMIPCAIAVLGFGVSIIF